MTGVTISTRMVIVAGAIGIKQVLQIVISDNFFCKVWLLTTFLQIFVPAIFFWKLNLWTIFWQLGVVVRTISLDAMHLENIWLSWFKASSIIVIEKLVCHACDGHRTES